jgi:uncharacterized protein YggE
MSTIRFGEGAETSRRGACAPREGNASTQRGGYNFLARKTQFVQVNGMKLLCLALACVPICLLAGDGLPNQPYLYVLGTAEIDKPPDIATLQFSLVTRDPNQVKANNDVQTRANKVFALLKEKKISQDDVMAQDIKTEAQFERNEAHPQEYGKLIGYEVSRPFTVKIRDITIFPKLVDELIATGNAQINSFVPGLSNEKEIAEQLWDKAIANARDKGEKTLKQVGMKIDSVFAISPVPFPQIYTDIFQRDERERVIVTGSNIPTAEEGRAQYWLGPVTVSRTIHVIYLISPAK